MVALIMPRSAWEATISPAVGEIRQPGSRTNEGELARGAGSGIELAGQGAIPCAFH